MEVVDNEKLEVINMIHDSLLLFQSLEGRDFLLENVFYYLTRAKNVATDAGGGINEIINNVLSELKSLGYVTLEETVYTIRKDLSAIEIKLDGNTIIIEQTREPLFEQICCEEENIREQG